MISGLALVTRTQIKPGIGLAIDQVGCAIFCQIKTTVKNNPRVILRLRIPGIIPGGYPEYPDQLRGGSLTVAVTCTLKRSDGSGFVYQEGEIARRGVHAESAPA